tara:strand:- start:2612 stop:3727 length:1116 start_codon:yes stop_codon:yes gene_type:complete
MVAAWIGNGWHPALFRSEANSLGKMTEIIHPRVVLVEENVSISQSAFIDYSLSPFDYSIDEPNPQLIADWFVENQPFIDQSIAVRVSKMGKFEGMESTRMQSEIGGLLYDKGWKIDLENPDIEIIIHYCGNPEKPIPPDSAELNYPIFVWGILSLSGPGGYSFQNRSPTERPFFKPVSLDPRLARAMVNLCYSSGSPPSYIIDPFCGTGGIAIESAMIGIPVYASDLDSAMVQGTIDNVAQIQFDGEIIVQSCDAIKIHELLGEIEGAAHVFDPPYGRNSWTSGEGIQILKESITSLSFVSRGPMVMLLPINPEVVRLNPDLLNIESFSPFGVEPNEFKSILTKIDYEITFIHPIWVHRSLARALIRIDPC